MDNFYTTFNDGVNKIEFEKKVELAFQPNLKFWLCSTKDKKEIIVYVEKFNIIFKIQPESAYNFIIDTLAFWIRKDKIAQRDFFEKALSELFDESLVKNGIEKAENIAINEKEFNLSQIRTQKWDAYMTGYIGGICYEYQRLCPFLLKKQINITATIKNKLFYYYYQVRKMLNRRNKNVEPKHSN